MNQELVDPEVQSVLCEGLNPNPYRAPAKKNRRRFKYGRVYPGDYSRAQHGVEPCLVQAHCLAEGAGVRLEVTVRFLHPMAREIGALAVPRKELPHPDLPDFFHQVQRLEVDGELYESWLEVTERTVSLPALDLGEIAARPPREFPFSFPASRTIEAIRGRRGVIVGVIVRRQAAIAGLVTVAAERRAEIEEAPADGAGKGPRYRITVRIENRTPLVAAELDDLDAVSMRTFNSTQMILHPDASSSSAARRREWA